MDMEHVAVPKRHLIVLWGAICEMSPEIRKNKFIAHAYVHISFSYMKVMSKKWKKKIMYTVRGI